MNELGKSLDEGIWNNDPVRVDMGFWVAIAAVFLIVVLMNAVFWGMKPKNPD
ncbi:MAG: hypothetical protein V8Q30_13725 [Acutalibacteraceae bacterium]